MTAVLYRYEICRRTESRIDLVLQQFHISKRTPAGAWIYLGGGPEVRFVNLQAKKQYASETPERALEGFHARKRRQVSILRHRLKEAEAALTLSAPGQRAYLDIEELG